MKILFIYLLTIQTVWLLTEEETSQINDISRKLYTVEDKIDHLLFHFNHDVTRHNYKITKSGSELVADPVNENSIHQKLKLIDQFNSMSGYSKTSNYNSNPAYNSELGEPNMPIPIQKRKRN